ncbi:acetyl-CoA carboxylase biotin carboxylase subunit [Vallitalea guaymasensis]|uniref:Biotin carboxylase n=1 Tax=Vallitalea guaymasensis TaxID=1185412 RepID=A0A8J8M8X4_9FIRM|nr:acetyl-CoA carboxylase biotin carboxylase subunit [Vallitalea guaymasensis]QUH28469.1 acetyl-CoA carboxylase biotin carboxylase subunit [Vallitalea guaymasensis]
MFKKILIANRGEIAVRVIRACREMGIKTLAVCSDIDRNSLHTKLADETICIGSANAKESYLNTYTILSAAFHKGVDAIHPGYGFLSENSQFAKMCEECSITFIGPSSNTIELMGNKVNARNIVKQMNCPVMNAIENIKIDEIHNRDIEKEIGYPVIIKAVSGGGGRGIRIVHSKEELYTNILNAKTEAENYFGNAELYIEKYIKNARHIEFQILADNHGNVVHLGERECSIQRKNQKMIEECPSSILDNDMRNTMGQLAIAIAKEVNYSGVGTVEFLLDDNMNYYFLEMNTRIQVEHPVTEMVTGIDLIKEQIKVAAGMNLDIKQEDICINGHSVECRINADDADNNFIPQTGLIKQLILPGGPGVRVDSSVFNDYYISHYYDSLLAKIIVHGKDRDEAIKIMKRALKETEIKGIKNNIDFQYNIICCNEFESGNYNTQIIS